jgi:hypothetical protein
MTNLTRKDLEARYVLFEYFALRDQRNYYQRTITKYDDSAGQVNRIRATVSLLTGISAALAGLLAQAYFTTGTVCSTESIAAIPTWCSQISIVINTAIILSVALPATGGFFNTLADLYQWDKQISIYKNALENLEVADAHSPLDEMDNEHFLASMLAYTEGTLQVMSDESSQWGQSIRTPKGIQAYIQEAKEKAAAVDGDANASDEDESDSSESSAG